MYAQQQGSSYTVIHATQPRVSPGFNVNPIVYTSGCAVCTLMFGLFFSFTGAIMTGFSYRKPSPPFDTPFFTKNDAQNPLRIVGPVLLSIGLFLLTSSIVLCCIAVSKRNRQRGQILQGQQGQVITQHPPPPSSAYPQQLQAPYPPPSNFYQQNTQPTSYPSQQNYIPNTSYPSQQNYIPPPSYDEAQSNNQYKFNDPHGNVTPANPSASALNIPDASSKFQ